MSNNGYSGAIALLCSRISTSCYFLQYVIAIPNTAFGPVNLIMCFFNLGGCFLLSTFIDYIAKLSFCDRRHLQKKD